MTHEQPTKRRGPLLWLSRRTWRFWGAAAIMLPIVYIASFGPVCWIMSRKRLGPRPSFLKPGEVWTPLMGAYTPGPSIYKPLFYLAGHNGGPLGNALRSYIFYGIRLRQDRYVFTDEDIHPHFRDDGIWWARLDPSEVDVLNARPPSEDSD